MVDRLKSWMVTNPISDLVAQQYGFREGRSTYDALSLITETIREATEDGEFVVAVGIDIQNAFNSISWSAIRTALCRKQFPEYLRRIIDDYLHQRTIEYVTADGSLRSRTVTAGVPQGSILGPLLWNVAFDGILRLDGLYGGRVVCYADDTVVLTTADDSKTAADRATLLVCRVLREIRGLGLNIAANKTEVVLFRPRRSRWRPDVSVRVGDIEVVAEKVMKYLGILLDSRLNFEDHFATVETKVSGAVRSLSRLMPNLRDPGEKKRKLYANIISAMALYGAPIWADALLTSRKNEATLRRVQRSCAIRVATAYRTVSHEAACLLVRTPPYILQAQMYKRLFLHIRALKRSNDWTAEGEREVRRQESLSLREHWLEHIQDCAPPGRRTKLAILPNIEAWMSRKWGSLDFHMVQLLTGHGCFGSYLYRIGRIRSPECWFCHERSDTAEHTLLECPGWNEARMRLVASIGGDLSLSHLIAEITRSREAWTAFAIFASKVMGAKEDCERLRESDDL